MAWFCLAEGHPEPREDAETRKAEEDKRDKDAQDPTGRPPKPTGPYEFYWHQGQWKRKRADGRLMAVDQSGTFVRKRYDRSGMARPPTVPEWFWADMDRAERM